MVCSLQSIAQLRTLQLHSCRLSGYKCSLGISQRCLCVIVTNYQVKQFEQIKEKEVIREMRNIWKLSKNKLKTESKDSIFFTSNSYLGSQTNEYPFIEDIITFLTPKRATQAFPYSYPDLVFQTKFGLQKTTTS